VKLSKLMLILICVSASGILSGCSVLPSRPVYVGSGQIVEIAEPKTFVCWVKNKETGKRERRKVRAEAGWYVGRPEDGPKVE